MLNQSMETTQYGIVKSERKWLFLFILMLMSSAGLIGSDVYLPTLPAMGNVLKQNSHAMQLTLGIFLLGLSLGQLILGPLTDRFGRKKIVILGMLLYCLASISCAFSSSYAQLLIFRLLQALGACSGLVIGRAIVGDLYDPKEAGKVFSTIFPFVGMSPAISPVIGGFIGYYFGWQGTFLFVSLFALLIIILSSFFLPETLRKENRRPFHITQIISNYPKLIANRQFMAYVSAPCFAYFAYFAYIAQSPFIFYAHGYTEREIGFFYIALSISYVAGSLLGKKLLNYFELNKVISAGYIIFNLGGLILLITGIENFNLVMMVFSMSILTFGNGFIIPLGTAGAITSISKLIGYGSGLLGFLQLGVAALTATLVGIFCGNSILKLGIYIFITTLLGMFLFIILIKHKIISAQQHP